MTSQDHITTQSFVKQLGHYQHGRIIHYVPSSVPRDQWKKIRSGELPPTRQLADELTEALFSGDEAVQDPIARNAFLVAAYDAIPLQSLVREYCQTWASTTSNHGMAKYLGIQPPTLADIMENGTFQSFSAIEKVAQKLQLPSGYARRFYERFGGFHASKQHAIDDLAAGKIALNQAITSLSHHSHKPLKELFAPLGIPLETAKKWMLQNGDKPEFSSIRTLASAAIFNLTREQAEQFCEATGCFMDSDHLIKRLRDKENPISLATAIHGLVTLHYNYATEYARANKHDRETVMKWCNGHPTRLALMELTGHAKGCKGAASTPLADEDMRLLMEKAGFYFDAPHLARAFEDKKDFNEFVLAIKSTYGLSDTQLGLHPQSIHRHRVFETTPTIASMVSIFKMVESHDPAFRQCWDSYKNVCSRFLGHGSSGRPYDIFCKKMENEYQSAKKQSPGQSGDEASPSGGFQAQPFTSRLSAQPASVSQTR